ncbi:unnamed protein product, partial [Staurois parvus]
PFQSGHFPPFSPDTFPPLPVSGHFPPHSSPDTFPPFQTGHFHPLPVRTLSPPSSPDTFPPFQTGHFPPLPNRTLLPPSLNQRQFSAFSAITLLNDNCAGHLRNPVPK